MVLCHCYRMGCLVWRVIAMLLGATFVYVAGGTISVYETLFGDISISQNATVAAERAFVFVRDAYVAGRPPSSFHVWGMVAAGIYILGCLVYFVIKCNCIARDCSSSVDDAPTSASSQQRRLITTSSRSAERENSGDLELAQMRNDYEPKRIDL